MSEFLTHTARLIPYTKRPKAATGFVTAYLFEPTPGESGADLGSLYIAIEVLSGGREAEEVVDLTIETLGSRYYNNDHSGSVMDRFETAIKATNRELADYINRGHAGWVGKMSAVAAILSGDELHIAQTGSAEAYLYRGRKASRITIPPSNRVQQPSKVFGSIASGTLEISDTILLTTPALIHQLPLDVLRDTVSENPPNVAIAKFTELLAGSDSASRVAALVIRLTTPELAAQAVRLDAPSDIAMGNGGTFLENARATAAPLAASAVDTSRKLGLAARLGGRRYLPMLQAAGFKLADWLRNVLSSRRGRYLAGGLLGAAVIIVAVLIYTGSHNQDVTRLVQQFETLASQETKANQLIQAGNTTQAQNILKQIQPQATSLSRDQARKSLDARLSQAALPEGEATSINGLLSAISASQDAIDHVVTASPVVLTDLSKVKAGAKPNQIDIIGSRAIAIDSTNHNAIYRVDLVTGTAQLSTADTSRLGKVVATTPASGGDGVYILTSAPAVWLYRPSDDTLTAQTIGNDNWPKTVALSSYDGNLYLIGQSTLYKSLPTLSGFAPATAYLTATSAPLLANATALAVDGSIYIAGPSGLYRYLAGTPTGSAALPSGLNTPSQIATAASSTLLMVTDSAHSRVGVFTLTDSSISFLQQFKLAKGSITAASYDDTTKTFYLLSGSQIVKFNINF